MGPSQKMMQKVLAAMSLALCLLAVTVQSAADDVFSGPNFRTSLGNVTPKSHHSKMFQKGLPPYIQTTQKQIYTVNTSQHGDIYRNGKLTERAQYKVTAEGAMSRPPSVTENQHAWITRIETAYASCPYVKATDDAVLFPLIYKALVELHKQATNGKRPAAGAAVGGADLTPCVNHNHCATPVLITILQELQKHSTNTPEELAAPSQLSKNCREVTKLLKMMKDSKDC